MTHEENCGVQNGVLALGQIAKTLAILREAIETDTDVVDALALVEVFADAAASKLDRFTN